MPIVNLGPYNTVAITAVNGVYRLKAADGASHPIDLLNLGPGAIFVRDDLDPTVNGANTLQVAANWAVNRLTVQAGTGLGIIAAADTVISVRMT